VTDTVRWLLRLPVGNQVVADVHDSRGRRVRSLLAGPLNRGQHVIVWDGRTTGGDPAPPGVYFLNLRAGRDRVTDKVVRFGR
jgi:hypothetical protein